MSPIKTKIIGHVRGPKVVELDESLDLPEGSEIFFEFVFHRSAPSHAYARFAEAAGSWSEVPERVIEEVYAARRDDARPKLAL